MRQLHCLLLLLSLLALGGRPSHGAEAALPALKHATLSDASFDYPAELISSAEKDGSGSQVNLKAEEGLPWILVEAFSVRIEPKAAVDIFIRKHKEECTRKNWPFTVSAVQETIGGQLTHGEEIAFRNEAVSFRQRFYATRLRGRTILVMVMAKTEDDELARQLMAPIASTLKVTPDPRLAEAQKVILYSAGGVAVMLLLAAGAVVMVLVRKSRRRAMPPPLPPPL